MLKYVVKLLKNEQMYINSYPNCIEIVEDSLIINIYKNKIIISSPYELGVVISKITDIFIRIGISSYAINSLEYISNYASLTEFHSFILITELQDICS